MAAERSSSCSETGFVVDCSLAASDHKGGGGGFLETRPEACSEGTYEANVTIPVGVLVSGAVQNEQLTEPGSLRLNPSHSPHRRPGPSRIRLGPCRFPPAR